MSDTSSAPTDEISRVILEGPQPLSRSILWQIQRRFFERRGVDAWRRGIVPHYITSNPHIANVYANIVFGFLRDCYAVTGQAASTHFPPFDLSEPIYIIELGAGSGRFAYHFLKKFNGFFRQSVLKDVPVQYVMTDFASRTVDYWCEHSSLVPFQEEGLLDFALFDAEQPHELNLIRSGRCLAPGTLKNPLIVIANYFFDGIPQDLFSVQTGRLHENLISVSSSQPEPDLGSSDLLSRIEIAYECQPITADHYSEEDFNQILQLYQQRLVDTTFTFPSLALRCIQYFSEFAHGRLMLLSADKGYNREEQLLGLGEPGLNVHGSFSMMVNYHAIARYTAQRGGEALQTSYRHTSLCVAAFLFGPPPHGYVETRQAFNEAIEKGGPDDFFTLKKVIEQHYADFSLEQLLAYLRVSGWDASILLGSLPTLLLHLETAALPVRQDLYRAIQQVWDTYYPLGEASDLPFHLGMLLQAMTFYPEAIVFYDRSVQLCGPDPSTFFNLGMCHYGLRQLDLALTAVEHALELDPEFEAAKAMRIKLQSEIAS